MVWTYAQVKAADAALLPATPDPGAAAAALNAQTTTLSTPAADVGLGDIQGILLLSGEWLKIEARAGTKPSGSSPPTAVDNAITPAQLALQLVASKSSVVSAANWAAFLGMVELLVASGDVSSASYAAIQALAPMTAPAWQPTLTAGDIQTARAQP